MVGETYDLQRSAWAAQHTCSAGRQVLGLTFWAEQDSPL